MSSTTATAKKTQDFLRHELSVLEGFEHELAGIKDEIQLQKLRKKIKK